MPRLIDADALREAMFSYYQCVNEDSTKQNYRGEKLMDYEVADLIEDCIDNAPTIDPESLRPHGGWVRNGTCNHKPARFKNPDLWIVYKCSECGYSNGRRCKDKYCPNCGAKMDLEEEMTIDQD